MKIATWNLDQLRYNATRAARQREHIREIGADVWVFTETCHDFTLNGFAHIASSASAPDIPDGACWVSIWSKLTAKPIELEFDRERCAAIELESGLIIVGTVLPWIGDGRQAPLNGTAAFQARLREQATDWKRLQERSGDRLCVAGDFNQDLLAEGHYYHSAGSRAALSETLRACGLRCLTGKESDPLLTVPGRASIDHICIGEGLRATAPAEVWPKPGAPLDTKEHYGVWAMLDAV